MQFVIIEIEGEEPVVLPAVLLERDVRVSLATSSADPAPRAFRLRLVDGAIVAEALARLNSFSRSRKEKT